MPLAILNCLWSQTHPQQQHTKYVTKRMLPKQLPQLLGLLSHQERKEKKRKKKWGRRIRKEESVLKLCLLSSTAQTHWTFTLWPKTLFMQKVVRKELRSRGGMLAGYKLMLFCTYCLLHINICWVLSHSKSKPRRAGDSIWCLQAIFSFPGLAGDGHNSSWHNLMKFHSIRITEGEMLQSITIST